MLPVIYSASSTEFSSNGQGVLIDCISCEVTEERNGIFEMALTYPEYGQHADKLVVDAIIKATAHKGDGGQLFRIYSIDKSLDGTIEVQCQHISYQLSFIPCEPFEATNVTQAFTRLQQNMMIKDHGFTFSTDKTTTADFKIKNPMSSRSVLGGVEGSILDTYRGEYEFDNFSIKLRNHRGNDNGVTLRYGKNITDISEECNIADTYTGLRPYYYDEDELIELDTPDKCIWASNADSFPYKRILTLDCTSEFEELTDSYGDKRAPTQNELMSYAKKYMSNHDFGEPKVTVKVDFEALWDTPEYKDIACLEEVHLCDTVHVLFEPYNISVKSKVVTTVYDTLLDRYKSITVGSASSSFSDAVASIPEKTSSMIAESSTKIERAQQRATNTLLGKNGGYKVEKTNGDGQIIETLYMDSLEEALASKVWRWNINGLGYSPNGPAGPYTVAITKNGEIVADFITTGTLDADKVQVTHLYADDINIDSKTKLNQTLDNLDSTMMLHEAQIQANSLGLISKVSTSDYTGTKIASMINQSASSVTIEAQHIALTGANIADRINNSASTVTIEAGHINLLGATTVNNNVHINNDGTITAKNATISGVINATQLNLLNGEKIDAGDVDGLATVATSGKYTDLTGKPNLTTYIAADGTVHGSDPGEGATGIKVSSQGLLTASNAVIYGTIYASDGRIAGWTIGGSSIYKTRGDYTVSVNAPASPTAASKAFYVQKTTGGTTTYPFYVDYSGKLHAEGAEIVSGSTPRSGVTGLNISSAGLLTASNAVIYGELHAGTGDIGGWKINSTNLLKVSTNKIGGNYYRALVSAPATPSSTSRAFAVQHAATSDASSWEDDFYVSFGGKLYAKNAEIEGKITATEGEIGGCRIANGTLQVANGNIISINGGKISGANSITEDKVDAKLLRTADLVNAIYTVDTLIKMTSLEQYSPTGRLIIDGYLELPNRDVQGSYVTKYPRWYRVGASTSSFSTWEDLRNAIAGKWFLIGE